MKINTNLEYMYDTIDKFMDNLNEEIKNFLTQNKVDYSRLNSIPSYENPFSQPLWKLRNIGIPNCSSRFFLNYLTLLTKCLEIITMKSPSLVNEQKLLEKMKREIKNIANKVVYIE